MSIFTTENRCELMIQVVWLCTYVFTFKEKLNWSVWQHKNAWIKKQLSKFVRWQNFWTTYVSVKSMCVRTHTRRPFSSIQVILSRPQTRSVARKPTVGGLDILKLEKTPLIYSVSYFNLGAWSFVWWAKRTDVPPWRRNCRKRQRT